MLMYAKATKFNSVPKPPKIPRMTSMPRCSVEKGMRFAAIKPTTATVPISPRKNVISEAGIP